MDRRTYLGLVGAVAVPLAGCAGDERTLPNRGPRSTSSRRTDTSDSSTLETVSTTASEASESATTTVTEVHPGYETTTVQAVRASGEPLGSVMAAIADTSGLRYRGLSDTEQLPPDRGMLFVYESVADRVFVMREMDFGIDIVYADAEGTITSIHHAPAPGPDEDGDDQHYPGRGQYVLEVNYGWTTDHGIREGDDLVFSL